MSKKTSYLLGILLTIIIGTLLYWNLCCKKCKGEEIEDENKTVVIPTPKEIELAPFGIKEVNDNLFTKMEEQFNFGKSNFIVSDSLPKDVNDGVLKIKEYLDENGEKRFNITGYYTSDEVNNSAYPNLGLARANAVKTYMVKKGISPKLINTFGELNDKLSLGANDIIYKAIDFGLADKADDETAKKELEELMKACEALKSDPLVLYFQTGQAAINLSATQREKFSKITNCVDKLGAKVEVVGHTDNTGDPAKNMELGQGRADFAKGYLVRNGIISSNINATSKGQTEPIRDNSTAEGRAKNRRTVVTIN